MKGFVFYMGVARQDQVKIQVHHLQAEAINGNTKPLALFYALKKVRVSGYIKDCKYLRSNKKRTNILLNLNKMIKTKIRFKSKLAHIANIEKRNKAFLKLSDEDKRKEIAYDCLTLLRTGKIEGANGRYWGEELCLISGRTAADFQKKLINQLPNNCEVCARGGIMLSQIRLGNTIGHRNSQRSKGEEKILKGFSMQSMLSMEQEYEWNQFQHPHYPRTTEKLANICCNIIKNGDFNTNDRKNYLKAGTIP